MELRQESTVAELYTELLQKHGFPVGALAYREAKTEVVPIKAPNGKRGQKPDLLSVEELHKQVAKTALAEVLYPETVLDLYSEPYPMRNLPPGRKRRGSCGTNACPGKSPRTSFKTGWTAINRGKTMA